MLTIDEVKEYLRVDEDEVTLQTMMNASERVFRNNGVKSELLPTEDLESFKMAQLMLIAHWYENRGVMINKDVAFGSSYLPFTVEHIINSLKLVCIPDEVI